MAIKLMTQSVDPIPLAAALPGGAPAHTAFTLTSSGEPFLHRWVLRRWSAAKSISLRVGSD
jgi:hypothetical protein